MTFIVTFNVIQEHKLHRLKRPTRMKLHYRYYIELNTGYRNILNDRRKEEWRRLGREKVSQDVTGHFMFM